MKLTASIGVARLRCWSCACADRCATTILRSSATPCSALRLNHIRRWVFDTKCIKLDFFLFNLWIGHSPHYHMFYCNYPKSSNYTNKLLQLKIMIDHGRDFIIHCCYRAAFQEIYIIKNKTHLVNKRIDLNESLFIYFSKTIYLTNILWTLF